MGFEGGDDKIIYRELSYIIMGVEIKQGDRFSRKYFNQVNSYLKVTKLKLAILINFTSKGVKFKRLVNLI